MKFTELKISQLLQQAINKMGFEEMTPIQEQAIPPTLEGRDVLGSAQTGTGKTLAFLIPAMERLLADNSRSHKEPRLVVLTPTRELAIQVSGEARKLAAQTKLQIVSVYGGARMSPQINKLRRGADIVVATPGRLMDHMRRRNVSLRQVQIAVLDEADRMLDMGFVTDIKYIVGQMPRKRQTLFFSATIPPAVLGLTREFLYQPTKIELDIDTPPTAIRQLIYPVPKHLKTDLLMALLEDMEVESMLVFTATKQEADIVARKLSEAGFKAGCIHGDFQQRHRVAALEGFRSGKHRVLVATNIAARGLDVEGISHVVNYDMPENPEEYIHRIGRTARADATGTAISLVTPEDEVLVYRVEYLLKHKIDRKTLAEFDYNIPAPSWAKPSAETLLRRSNQNRNIADRWRSLSRR